MNIHQPLPNILIGNRRSIVICWVVERPDHHRGDDFVFVFSDRSSGTSRDWAAGMMSIPYVYTIELRDEGSFGFLLPPDQILETGVETWEGVKTMMAAIRRIEADKIAPSNT